MYLHFWRFATPTPAPLHPLHTQMQRHRQMQSCVLKHIYCKFSFILIMAIFFTNNPNSSSDCFRRSVQHCFSVFTHPVRDVVESRVMFLHNPCFSFPLTLSHIHNVHLTSVRPFTRSKTKLFCCGDRPKLTGAFGVCVSVCVWV